MATEVLVPQCNAGPALAVSLKSTFRLPIRSYIALQIRCT